MGCCQFEASTAEFMATKLSQDTGTRLQHRQKANFHKALRGFIDETNLALAGDCFSARASCNQH
jgi:hypothetical protein